VRRNEREEDHRGSHMKTSYVVRLLKAWKEKALEMERQAESENGLKREKLLAMAKILSGCEEDLKDGLIDELLELGEFFEEERSKQKPVDLTD
jgi:hypothetical protein